MKNILLGLLKIILITTLVVVLSCGVWIYFKGTQPMEILDARGITFWQFMRERWDAYKSVDVKVLTALAGLWPAALFSALVVQGIWGIVVLKRRGCGNEFRAIPAYALGALLSAVLLV